MRRFFVILLLAVCSVFLTDCYHGSGQETVLEKWKQIEPGHKHVIYDVFFGPNHKSVISCGGDIRLFSCPDLKLLKVQATGDIIFDADISKDRSSIVTVTGKNFFEIRKTSDLNVRSHLKNQFFAVNTEKGQTSVPLKTAEYRLETTLLDL